MQKMQKPNLRTIILTTIWKVIQEAVDQIFVQIMETKKVVSLKWVILKI